MSEEGEEVFHLGTKRLFQKSGRVKLLQLLMSEHSFFLPSGAVQKKTEIPNLHWEKGKENFHILPNLPKERLGL